MLLGRRISQNFCTVTVWTRQPNDSIRSKEWTLFLYCGLWEKCFFGRWDFFYCSTTSGHWKKNQRATTLPVWYPVIPVMYPWSQMSILGYVVLAAHVLHHNSGPARAPSFGTASRAKYNYPRGQSLTPVAWREGTDLGVKSAPRVAEVLGVAQDEAGQDLLLLNALQPQLQVLAGAGVVRLHVVW